VTENHRTPTTTATKQRTNQCELPQPSTYPNYTHRPPTRPPTIPTVTQAFAQDNTHVDTLVEYANFLIHHRNDFKQAGRYVVGVHAILHSVVRTALAIDDGRSACKQALPTL
jgi:hypothetical protein